jgi:pimeloyl-ACP methyl ester carboxylesterase
LSDKYTIVAPDLRGYNLSDRPGNVSHYTLEHLSEDVAGLIRHFGRDKAAVIGHDWGASIAWATALRKPELIWKLGALQVPPAAVWKKNQSVSQLFASWYMFFFQLPALPELFLKRNNYEGLARALRETTATPGIISDDEIAEYRKAWDQPGAITAMLNYYRANILKRMFGKSTAVQQIDVPTLFIYGEQDKAVIPQTVAGIGDVISGPYTEHRIPRSGHWVQQEAADEVTSVLQTFLAD